MKNTHNARIYMNGKKVTFKAMVEKYGEARLSQRLEDAYETFQDDPYTLIEYMDGMEIRFAE